MIFLKILIVEDDENIFEMLKKELLLWNYEVKGISNFNQIVEEFVEYQPHLVLMDIFGVRKSVNIQMFRLFSFLQRVKILTL